LSAIADKPEASIEPMMLYHQCPTKTR